MDDELFIVGLYNELLNKILATPLKSQYIYQSPGLKKHIIKHGHRNCLPYYDKISEIIKHPDYVGVNPNEKGVSFELVKLFERNILIGIKLDPKQSYLFVSTMYDITDAKLKAKRNCGRLRKFTDISRVFRTKSDKTR